MPSGFEQFLGAANPILGLLGQVFGGIFGNRDEKWDRNTGIDLLNYGRGMSQYGQDRWQDIMGPLRERLFQQGDQGNQFLWNNLPGLQEQIRGFGNTAPDLFQSSGISPEMAGVFNTLMGNAESQNPLRDIMSQVAQGGGWTPQSEEAFSKLFSIANGGGNVMGSLSDIGPRLVNQEGQTNYTRNLLDRASDVLNQGGMTGGLNTAQDRATELANAYGRTPQIDAMQNLAFNRVAAPALLPMQQVLSFAKENAARTAGRQFEAAQRRALARGGGPGAVVASGLQNKGQADYADAAAELESQMMIDALMKQQGLNLQQQGQNIGLLLTPEQLASQRQLSAMGLLPEITGASTNRAGTLGGLGNAALGQETARMGVGGSLMDQFLRSQLGALSGVGSLLGTQNQYALGAGNLAGNLNRIPIEGSTAALQQLISGGRLGLERGAGTADILTKLLGQQLQGLGLGQQASQATYNPLTALAGQGTDILKTGAQVQSAPFGNVGVGTTPNSYWGQIFNTGKP